VCGESLEWTEDDVAPIGSTSSLVEGTSK
jgi:hypothetical protein